MPSPLALAAPAELVGDGDAVGADDAVQRGRGRGDVIGPGGLGAGRVVDDLARSREPRLRRVHAHVAIPADVPWGRIRRSAEDVEEVPARGELLVAVVAFVGDEDVAVAVEGHPRGPAELAGPAATCPELPPVGAV